MWQREHEQGYTLGKVLLLGTDPLATDISCRLHACRGDRTMKWFLKLLVEVAVVVILGGVAVYVIITYVVK